MDLREVHKELITTINDIDEKLDSLIDSKTVGKRKITNELIEKSKESWEKVAVQINAQLSEAPADVRVGVYYGLTRALNEALGQKVAADIEAMVASMPVQTPLISPEEAPQLSTVRSELYQKVKSVISLAEQFGENAGMEMPRKRTGATGPRGKRALSLYTWYIDEKQYDKLKEVVDLYDQYDKVAELTKAMRDAKIDTSKPPARIEFTLPDGKILVGVGPETSSDDDDDDEEDEDDIYASE